MDDDTWYDTSLPASRLTLIDFFAVGVALLRDTAGAVEDALATLHELTLMHINHNVQQGQFHQEAAQEIERLVDGSD